VEQSGGDRRRPRPEAGRHADLTNQDRCSLTLRLGGIRAFTRIRSVTEEIENRLVSCERHENGSCQCENGRQAADQQDQAEPEGLSSRFNRGLDGVPLFRRLRWHADHHRRHRRSDRIVVIGCYIHGAGNLLPWTGRGVPDHATAFLLAQGGRWASKPFYRTDRTVSLALTQAVDAPASLGGLVDDLPIRIRGRPPSRRS
jgi:hypothetical protein